MARKAKVTLEASTVLEPTSVEIEQAVPAETVSQTVKHQVKTKREETSDVTTINQPIVSVEKVGATITEITVHVGETYSHNYQTKTFGLTQKVKINDENPNEVMENTIKEVTSRVRDYMTAVRSQTT